MFVEYCISIDECKYRLIIRLSHMHADPYLHLSSTSMHVSDYVYEDVKCKHKFYHLGLCCLHYLSIFGRNTTAINHFDMYTFYKYMIHVKEKEDMFEGQNII